MQWNVHGCNREGRGGGRRMVNERSMGRLDGDGLLDLVGCDTTMDFDDIWCGERKQGYRAYCHPDQFQPIAAACVHNEGHGALAEFSEI